MKNIVKNLDKIITLMLCISIFYSFYSIFISIYYFGYSGDFLEYLKPLLMIFIVSFMYIFFRKKYIYLEIIISVYFFINYMVFSNFGTVIGLIFSQFKQMHNNGFNFYQLLNISMSVVWISLMILPIVHFLYLKKNKIPPYV